MRKGMGMLMACVFATPAIAADVYRWVDQNGVVNYSDQLPIGIARNFQQKQIYANVIDAQPSYSMVTASHKHPVVLFGGDCGPLCGNARALLEKRGIPYTLKDPQKSRQDAVELNRLTGGMNLPVLRIGDQIFKGFEAEKWNEALDHADYPRTPIPHDGLHAAAQHDAAAPASASSAPDVPPPAANAAAPSASSGR